MVNKISIYLSIYIVWYGINDALHFSFDRESGLSGTRCTYVDDRQLNFDKTCVILFADIVAYIVCLLC